MTPPREWRLETTHLGRRVLVFDALDSTSNHAAALASDPANAGVVVLADQQTAGRGQHGRSWQCPSGAGVLMSLLLFPPPALRRPALLTAWAAVSVCETVLAATGSEAQIKWPNDVLIEGRKVCGILIEQGRGVVVGIGLNVGQSAQSLAEAGLPLAGSLAVFCDPPPRDEVARRLILELDSGYAGLCRGDLDTLEACWKRRLGLLGQRVRVECPGEVYSGRLVEVAFDGVELETDRGEPLRFPPERVLHLTAEG